MYDRRALMAAPHKLLKPPYSTSVPFHTPASGPSWAPAWQGEDRTGPPLSVVFAVGDLLTLFEHVSFGLVVGVLILGVAIAAGSHGCESYSQVPGMQQVITAGVHFPLARPLQDHI